MMPVIRITDDTWDRLKQWAVPLEDTPEDAVSKVLDAAEEHLRCVEPTRAKPKDETDEASSEKGDKLRRGLRTPQQAYRRPILEAIYELGGKGTIDRILEKVEEKMKDILGEVDYEGTPKMGYTRWVNTTHWEHSQLVKEGVLKADSPRGIWKLSEKGIEEVKKGV